MNNTFNDIVKIARRKFSDNVVSEQLFDNARWSNGRCCAYCNSSNVSDNYMRYDRDYYCKSCRRFFSVKINTFLHNTKLNYQQWGISIYLILAWPENHQYPDVYDPMIAEIINVQHPDSLSLIRSRVAKAMALDVPLYPFGSLFKRYLPSV